MPEQNELTINPQRARLAEEVRRLLFEGMKKAEQAKNWELFTRYADAYRRMAA